MTKFVVQAGWEDAPHLSKEARDQLIGSYPSHERDARTRGIPQLGSGAIYPIPESEFVIDPIVFPEYWPRSYAMDVGWNRTAALWMAYDPESDTAYLYSEHYRGQAEPAIHAAAVRSRGEWMNGVIDPAARGRTQTDGTQLLSLYVDLGLRLTPADNAVEAGIFDVWQRFSTGRIKVFKTLVNFLAEYRMYRRNEKGAVVKENDHLMDCIRYLIRTGISVAICNPAAYRPAKIRAEPPFDPYSEFYK
ncbi:MAG TPA: terminase family protein [Candidatus Dormibacteraeota bacterium]|nr:terminase family protein [Candidatus Dormibacteraeota bacterium]